MKSVFITGGTSGLGAELAKLYLARGFRVGVCGRDPKKFHDNFKEPSSQLSFFELDVLDRQKVISTIQEFSCEDELELVIANAGVATGSKSLLPDFDRERKVLEINIFGVLNTIEAAFLVMKKQGRGHIAAVSSVAGFNGLPGTAAYSGSKSAVLKMCESYALAFPRFGIDMSVICPGFIKTPFVDENNHKMPFIMSASRAAKIISKSLDRKKVFISFPSRMYLVTRGLEILPRWVYRFFMKLPIFNYARK